MGLSRRTLVTAGAAVAIGLAGCGGGSIPASPVAAVQAAYKATTGVETAKISMSQTITATGRRMEFSGSGAIDFSESAVKLTMQSERLGNKATTVRMIDRVVYFKVPKTNAFMPKPWIKVDPSKFAKKTGGRLPAGGMGRMRSPAQMLSLLRSTSEQVTEVGTEEVRGVSTTHYKLRVDIQELATKQGASAKLARKLKEVVGQTIPVHVWLDDQNRVRRQQLDMTIKQQGKRAELSVTIEFFDFGAPVHITVPPPGKTMSMQKMLNGLEKMQQKLKDMELSQNNG